MVCRGTAAEIEIYLSQLVQRRLSRTKLTGFHML